MFVRMFEALVGHEIIVLMKNEAVVKGTLEWCDDVMNMKLVDVEVLNEAAFPHLPKITSMTLRGSSIMFVNLPPDAVDIEKLHAASRVRVTAPPLGQRTSTNRSPSIKNQKMSPRVAVPVS